MGRSGNEASNNSVQQLSHFNGNRSVMFCYSATGTFTVTVVKKIVTVVDVHKAISKLSTKPHVHLQLALQFQRSVYIQNSYMILIGVHEMHGRMHPN